MTASRRRGVIYTGVTANLAFRIYTHKHGDGGFTHRYHVCRLVWYESHGTMDDAIRHEKQIKNWRRSWKVELIEKNNPEWRDLYYDLNQ